MSCVQCLPAWALIYRDKMGPRGEETLRSDGLFHISFCQAFHDDNLRVFKSHL